MANYQSCKTVSLVAGEDLRGDMYEALTVNSAGLVAKTTQTTDVIIGTLAEEPSKDAATTGKTVPVAIIGGGGVLKMKAGAAITAGQLLVPVATAGRVAGVADIDGIGINQLAVGMALEGAADGDIFSVLAQSISGPAT